MTPNFGMLWAGADAQVAIDYFVQKYHPKVDFVLSAHKPINCPDGLWQQVSRYQKGTMLIGAHDFLPKGA